MLFIESIASADYHPQYGFSNPNPCYAKLAERPGFEDALSSRVSELWERRNSPAEGAGFAVWEPYLIVLEPAREQGKRRVLLPTLEGIADSLHTMKDEELYFNILEAMHDDFVIIDKEGVFETVLPKFEEIYGIPASEVVGQSIYSMEEKQIINPSIAARVMKSRKKETMLQQTGNGKYLMCTAIPIFDKEGRMYKIISYTRDVTEYESIKDEYEKLKEIVTIFESEIEQLRQEQNNPADIISVSNETRKIISMISRIAKFDSSVLITGESGVGKTMYAKLIHSQSARKNGPFIEINCGAIPENLLETELFGYARGAFTGANREGKPGMIELADGGTLFLDEIGDLPLHMQAKLLKTIQDHKITRVGGVDSRKVDFRLITATNRSISSMIASGAFREDLYYRLNVITIDIPPLRDRKDDIFHLIMHFTEKFCAKYNIQCAMSSEVIGMLVEYDWPGNIRELENTVERMVVTSDRYMISQGQLPPAVLNSKKPPEFQVEAGRTLKEMIERVEKNIFTEYYKQYGSTTKVAKALGISQPSASLKLTKYVRQEDNGGG